MNEQVATVKGGLGRVVISGEIPVSETPEQAIGKSLVRMQSWIYGRKPLDY